MARGDRLGEALLETVAAFAAAREGDVEDLPGALRLLRRAGLEDVARRGAIQLVVMGEDRR
jgi:hypothetical protein